MKCISPFSSHESKFGRRLMAELILKLGTTRM
jgi:hypothetical protein